MLNLLGFQAWTSPLVILAASIGLGYAAKSMFLKRLRPFLRQKSTLDSLVIESLSRFVPLWFFLAGLSMAAQVAPVVENTRFLIQRAAIVGFLLSITFAVSDLALAAVRFFSAESGASATTTTLTENLARVIVIGTGLMLILSNLGVSITPILTALGVGSLAVALAVQDILGNLFAGIQILASRMIHIGEHVLLDSGQEGHVLDIGWWATRLRDPGNNVIIIPNSKLSKTIIISGEESPKETTVEVGVSFQQDLSRVEKVTLAVADAVMADLPQATSDFKPLLRYNKIGESAVSFAVTLRARQPSDRPMLTHEFIKRLHKIYKEEGIEIACQQRAVRLIK